MAGSSKTIPFRMVAEARGGTFTFRKDTTSSPTWPDEVDHTEVDLIGTFHCNTCLGIYFPIDKYRCFATHINAWTRYDEPLNCADPDAGEYIKKQTTEKLQREAKENNWDPLSEGFGKVVYAVCRVFEVDFDGVMVETGGWYAAEAVREFLKTQADVVARNASWSHALRAHAAAIRKQAEEFVVMTDYQGFVVHNNSRKLVATFRANHNDVFYRRSPLDLGRYRPVTILSLDICKWSI